MANVIQNAGIPAIKDKVAEKATNEIFTEVIGLNYFKDLANDLTTNCVTELRNASFMTVDLELTEEQKSKLSGAMPQMVMAIAKSSLTPNVLLLSKKCLPNIPKVVVQFVNSPKKRPNGVCVLNQQERI